MDVCIENQLLVLAIKLRSRKSAELTPASAMLNRRIDLSEPGRFKFDLKSQGYTQLIAVPIIVPHAAMQEQGMVDQTAFPGIEKDIFDCFGYQDAEIRPVRFEPFCRLEILGQAAPVHDKLGDFADPICSGAQ